MREILFRGKRTDNGEWVEGHLIWCTDGGAMITPRHTEINGAKVDSEYFICHFAYDVIPSTIRQYTGLKDNENGTRIFEGDIIRYADLYDYNCYLESLDNSEAYDKWDFGKIWTVDEVVYCGKEGYPAFDLNKHNFETNGLSELSESRQYFYEVIGNIHDNPELLEVQK